MSRSTHHTGGLKEFGDPGSLKDTQSTAEFKQAYASWQAKKKNKKNNEGMLRLAMFLLILVLAACIIAVYLFYGKI